jgi:hypothetical protein
MLNTVRSYKQTFISSNETTEDVFNFARLRYKTKPSQKIRVSVSQLGFVPTSSANHIPFTAYLDGIFGGISTTQFSNGKTNNMWNLGSPSIGTETSLKFSTVVIDTNSVVVDEMPTEAFSIKLLDYDGDLAQPTRIMVTFNIDILE